MRDEDKNKLAAMVLAPWIQKATALRGERRKVGGNQFRHAMATMAILLDYEVVDNILLKAALIHDLIEDLPRQTSLEELKAIDGDGPKVVNLVLEVTRGEDESKEEFLARIARKGSEQARILKAADRISNLTDLHKGVFDFEDIKQELQETEEQIIPMLEQIRADKTAATSRVAGYMLTEIHDLLATRRRLLRLGAEIRDFSDASRMSFKDMLDTTLGLLRRQKGSPTRRKRPRA